MANVLKPPTESGEDLVFQVEHAQRQYTVTVKGKGGITVSGDFGAFNELVEAVRRYAGAHEDEIPKRFRSSSDLFPA